MRDYREIINGMFEELVPMSGKSDTVAGELVRAACRIGYRYYNDGDHLGIDYGKETCNAAGRFLCMRGGDDVAKAVRDAWGVYDDDEYEAALDMIDRCVVNHIENHPELREEANTEDMWDFSDDDDVWEEDEDDYGYWGEEEGYDDYDDDYYEGWD